MGRPRTPLTWCCGTATIRPIVMWSIGNEIDYPDDPFTASPGQGFDPSVPQHPRAKKSGLSADLMPRSRAD